MRRNIIGIYTIWYRDILRIWHDKMRMFGSFAFPLLFLFIFGSGLGFRVSSLGGDLNYIQFMFPGVIGMTVLMSSFMGGISVVWDREFGFLKEVLVSPVSRASVAWGKTLGSATIASAQGIIMLILSPLLGLKISLPTIFILIPLLLLLSCTMGSFGILLATRIRSMEAFQVVMQMLMFPMVFLSGVFFPLQGLPAWLNFLVKLNPATYGITPIRQIILGVDPAMPYNIIIFGHTILLWENILILIAFCVILNTLAVWSFKNQG